MKDRDDFLRQAIALARAAREAGKIYWAGIKSVVYGLSAQELATLAGPDFLIPCAELFARALDPVQVTGPLLLDEAREVHVGFWPSPTG